MSSKQAPQLFYFVSNRDFVLGGSLGHRIAFEKGQPTHVPKIMHAMALEKGILPCTKEGKPLDTPQIYSPEEAKVVLAPEDADERSEAIVKAMKAIVKRNNAKDFTSGSTPSASAVSLAVGWKVDPKEARQVWDKHRHDILETSGKGE
jgi:hypothetical protein